MTSQGSGEQHTRQTLCFRKRASQVCSDCQLLTLYKFNFSANATLGLIPLCAFIQGSQRPIQDIIPMKPLLLYKTDGTCIGIAGYIKSFTFSELQWGLFPKAVCSPLKSHCASKNCLSSFYLDLITHYTLKKFTLNWFEHKELGGETQNNSFSVWSDQTPQVCRWLWVENWTLCLSVESETVIPNKQKFFGILRLVQMSWELRTLGSHIFPLEPASWGPWLTASLDDTSLASGLQSISL